MSCNKVNCGGNNSKQMSSNTIGGGSGIRVSPNEQYCVGDFLDPIAKFLQLDIHGKGFNINQADQTLFSLFLNEFFVRVKHYSIVDSIVPNTNNDSFAEVVIPPDTNFFIMYPTYDANIDQRRWLFQWKLINDLNEEEPCPEIEDEYEDSNIDIPIIQSNYNVSFMPASKGCCDDCGCEDVDVDIESFKTSQFNCKDDYNLTNRLLILDIPSNMFTKIRFKNDIYRNPIPIKFLFINKGF